MAVERIRFANGELDDVASVLVNTSEHAGQYLAQAPAIAVLACGKFSTNITYGELDRFSGIVGRNPRLKDLLAEYGAPAQLRKIPAHTLRPRHRNALIALARLDASTLAQIIPTDSHGVWLDAIDKWLRLMPSGKKGQSRFSVEWVARRLSENMSRFEEVDTIIDWIGRGKGLLNEKWSWERTLAEVEAWHRSLRDEAALKRLAAAERERASFDTVICKAPLPDEANVAGYDFVMLRSLRKLREEGQVMHHCVASYANDVRKGRCSIASIRKDGVHIATLEISATGVSQQLKAHCNRSVEAPVRQAVDEYLLRHWRPKERA